MVVNLTTKDNKDNDNAPSASSISTTSITNKRPTLTPYAIQQETLKHVCLTFAVLSYYFVCDYWHFFERADRIYNRDLFVFLLALLFIVNIIYTSHLSPDGTSDSAGVGSSDKLLNRNQTEEWKGWMQVMFVWYHYYKAAETYNLIRLFIACYVWMTGFG